MIIKDYKEFKAVMAICSILIDLDPEKDSDLGNSLEEFCDAAVDYENNLEINNE